MNKIKFYTNRRNIVLLATLCCILWGSAYPSIKIGYSLFNINDLGSKLVFAGYRFTLAGILVLLLEAITKKNRINFSKKQFGQITSIRFNTNCSSIHIFLCGNVIYYRSKRINNKWNRDFCEYYISSFYL